MTKAPGSSDFLLLLFVFKYMYIEDSGTEIQGARMKWVSHINWILWPLSYAAHKDLAILYLLTYKYTSPTHTYRKCCSKHSGNATGFKWFCLTFTVIRILFSFCLYIYIFFFPEVLSDFTDHKSCNNAIKMEHLG